LPIKQCRNWFTLDEIKTKRAEIAKVIETLAAEQNPNNVFEYPDLNRHREESPGICPIFYKKNPSFEFYLIIRLL